MSAPNHLGSRLERQPPRGPSAKRRNYITLCIRPELRPKIQWLQARLRRTKIVDLIQFLVEEELDRQGYKEKP